MDGFLKTVNVSTPLSKLTFLLYIHQLSKLHQICYPFASHRKTVNVSDTRVHLMIHCQHWNGDSGTTAQFLKRSLSADTRTLCFTCSISAVALHDIVPTIRLPKILSDSAPYSHVHGI